MTDINIKRGDFAPVFGGVGFHNNEAMLYPIIEREHFNQKICKCYREISPGFMRTFGGFSDWTKEHMDAFAEYYEKMQKWTETPIYFAGHKGKLHFNDEERKAYAEAVSKNLNYLINEKNVKQLRYYCFSNEMSLCDWGGLLKDLPLFKKYHELLFEAFQNLGLRIGLLATDAAGLTSTSLDYAIDNMKQITEDFCLHEYVSEYDIYNTDFYLWFYNLCRDISMKCIKCDNKRFILGEFGIKRASDSFVYYPGAVKDANAFNYTGEGAYSALMYAEGILAAINAGTFAVVVWTYTDYPDPYVCHYAERDPFAKKWGMCEPFISETQDTKYNKYGLMKWEDDGDYSVREIYWCLGLICKYFKRNAKVLEIKTKDPMIRIAGMINRDGSFSIGIVNRHKAKTPIRLNLNLNHIEKQPPLRVFEYDTKNAPTNEFGDLQSPTATVTPTHSMVEYTLLPESFTLLTSDYKTKRETIFAKKVVRKGDILSWQPVIDEEHCYYRVYRGKTVDFTPSPENQIASTVDTKIDFSAQYLDEAAIMKVDGDFYKVISVDRSGNGMI